MQLDTAEGDAAVLEAIKQLKLSKEFVESLDQVCKRLTFVRTSVHFLNVIVVIQSAHTESKPWLSSPNTVSGTIV